MTAKSVYIAAWIFRVVPALGSLRKYRLVDARSDLFAGLTVEETAQALKVSSQTVMRDWSLARAWLARELGR